MGLVERLDRRLGGREGARVIVLASSSPRRRALLKEAGIRFRVKCPPYAEKTPRGVSPKTLVTRHALGKALSVECRDGKILGADTVVHFGGKIIGKPRDIKEGRRILGKLQGRWHAVWTGVALVERRGGCIARRNVFAVRTLVRLRAMTDENIRVYFRRVNPLDKAGAYAIQSKRTIVEAVRGSYSNAVGLPMERLRKLLK